MTNQEPFQRFQERSFEIHWEGSTDKQSTQVPSPPQIPIFSANSSLESPSLESPSPIRDPIETVDHTFTLNGRKFTIRGNNVLCQCPDCQAPMTVRLWLGQGKCWRCPCSLELSTREVEELTQALADQPSTTSFSSVSVPTPRVPVAQPSTPSFQFDASSVGEREDSREAQLEALAGSLSAAELVGRFLASLPAWVISFLFHLILILILALFVFHRQTEESISLIVSTFLDKSRTEGGQISLERPDRELADDLLPESSDLEPTQLDRARQDAQELTIDPKPLGNLAGIDQVKAALAGQGERSATFAARDPRLRAEIVEKEGGTTMTEAAVARGLRWLASVQNADGSWSLANYNRHERANNKGDAAATSLALLPFLGAGQTHEFGMYKSTVTRGLAWLMDHQTEDGDLRAKFPGQAGMYAHGQATICLCEAYALTGDERFREPARLAIDFIQNAQHSSGGWRYQPGQEGDTSVFGWQLMALQSARASSFGSFLNDDTLRLADYYLDTASQSSRVPSGALYRYQPGDGPQTPSMTAEALLCRMYLGWKRNDPRLMYGIRWLLKEHLPNREDPNLYYWYYGTQAMHHFGGPEWERWNRATRDMLVDMQMSEGRYAGSWDPQEFEWGAQGERIFVTSLAVCTLEVYYRHLPLFKPIDLD